jgi:predicted dienelactone hydrolase
MHKVSSARLLMWAVTLGAAMAMADTGRAGTANDPMLLKVADLDVAVWPPKVGAGPYPLALFSHGVGGCKTQSTYLMQALAEHGILVVAPDHTDKGARCPEEMPTPEEVMQKLPGLHEDRRDDFQKLRESIPTDPALSGWPIDPDRVVLIGHSLGGYTVLGLAGAWPSWKMARIAAVVALTPYAQPFLTNGAVESISVPVLLQSGGKDLPTLEESQERVFAKLTGPACKVVYLEANHFAWTNRETKFHDATAAATIAFLDEVFAKRVPTKAILASSEPKQVEDCK